jgi:hypothetical protein
LGVDSLDSIELLTDKDLTDRGVTLIKSRRFFSEYKKRGNSNEISSPSNNDTSSRVAEISAPNSTYQSRRLLAHVDDVEDTTYKGVLELAKSFVPNQSCKESLLSQKNKLELPELERIISDCEKFMQSKKLPSGISNDEIMAIVLYTHDLKLLATRPEDNFYFALNTMLRKREVPVMKLYQGYLYYLLNGLKKLPDVKAQVFRGISDVSVSKLSQEYWQGRKIHWSAFSSSTTSIETAKKFSASKLIFRIDIINGKNIQGLSMFPREDEILLSPNMSFIVTRNLTQEVDGFSYINLVQVASDSTLVF